MTLVGSVLLAASTFVFLLAASFAKSWAVAPGNWKLVATLILYSVGNLVMLRLVREFGMSIAFSLSAVIQLIAINIIAVGFYGERLSLLQISGVVLAIIAVLLITFAPSAR
ncbi:hypothetical protein M8997_018775 [Phyllobacterium sp. 21LDTY02-6]|uniref:hypothetical protein n=1 Tax=Phyllobacterium sp. 21LDTY02-6 TaxID=2944903 RepID=UPI002021A749|nr:hypothetical protein [Phyllobacterium sp. 21LDTY02-6]MCO4319234.1 hypothetical protein [Phyllobacterium sp. 21LDTY02-6]